MLKEEKIIADWSADMYEIDETETYDVECMLACLGTTPKRILEIACGSGRILVPLAKAGHTVVGLDLDEAMLAKIPAKAEGLDNIIWRIGDAIADDWGSGYDVVVIAGNFLMNIVSEEGPERAQRVLLEKAKRALKPGGMLYIDYNHTFFPEQWYVHAGERVIWEGTDSYGTSGRMLLCGSTYDEATRLICATRCYELETADGEKIREEMPSIKRYLAIEQLHGWLAEEGFRIEKEYGDYAGNPIGDATGRAIICAVLTER
ncbi:MAG: methyltransferase domain-containing protein [Lachnospiraceae bacterium]|nr:methyltransferase domain-containing protein [Lachnospiraceae bacterium]